MIGSVDVEIFVQTEIVKNKVKIKITKLTRNTGRT